jgi:hypothetical protein
LLSIAACSLARLMLAHSLSTLSCDGAPQYFLSLIADPFLWFGLISPDPLHQLSRFLAFFLRLRFSLIFRA